MKILLLGSNGQLGTDIQKVFKNNNLLDISCIDRKYLDVEDYSKIKTLLNQKDFNLLINCTSYHKTDEVEKFPDKAIKINSMAVKEMAKVCNKKRSKFVHISTDYVFHGDNNIPYKENDKTGPLNIYGLSKLIGESYIKNEMDDYFIIRVASLFGIAGASGKGGNFVESMIKMAKNNQQLNVVDDIIMSPTSTLCVANNIYNLITGECRSGVYHSVNSGQSTWFNFAKTIFKLIGSDYKINAVTSDEFKTVAIRPKFSALDNTKLSNEINSLIPNWEDDLEEYLKIKGYI